MDFVRVALLGLAALLAAADSMAQDAQMDASTTQTPTVAGSQADTHGPKRIRVGGNVAAAQLIHQVPPIYPAEAKAAHISGTVVLHGVIAKDGTIKQLEFVSGPPLLLKSAMDAVRQWQYKPTLLADEPVEVDTMITVIYTLGARPADYDQEAASSPTPAPNLPVEVEGLAIDCPGDGLLRVFVSPKVQATRILEKVEPIYPEEARKARIEGTVLFHAIIATNGTVKELTLEDGDPILAKAAEEAVRKWRYDVTPYVNRDGSHTRFAEVDTAIAVEFKLTK